MYSTIFLFQKSPLSKSLLRCRRSRSSPHTPTRGRPHEPSAAPRPVYSLGESPVWTLILL